jgi:putative ABC transport system permease protein
MKNLWQDLRYGVRTLRRNPRFTAVAIVALALGIGANTAIFSVVYGVLLRSLPYEEPDRLVVMLRQSLRDGGPGGPVAPANFYDWREQARSFEQMTAAEMWGPTLTEQDAPEKLAGLRASANLFEMLGAKPALGRGFLPEDERPENERVVVLSHGLWQRRFGGRADIVGQTLRLDGEMYTVSGVMPPGFGFPTFWAKRAELWTPLVFTPERAQSRGGSSLRIFGRLKAGTTLAQAQAEMLAISERLAQQFPETNSDHGAVVELLHDKTVGEIRPTIVVLAGAVGFLLLIACVNVANLLLARATTREREVAVRSALGAGRLDVIRQLLAESVVLSIAAGVLGVLLAAWGLNAVLAAIPETVRVSLPRREGIQIDGMALGFAFLLSLATAAVFGLAPALRTSRADLTSALKEGGRGTRGAGGRLRNALVVCEVALSLMLLTGAGLLIRSFVKLQSIDPGFEPRNVISMVVPVTGSQFGTAERKGRFYERLVDNVAALPGVESAAVVNHVPLEGDIWGLSFTIEGRPAPPPAEVPGGAYRVAAPRYFRTIGATLARGRDFEATDSHDAPRVAIVNETLARRHFEGEDPIGKRIKLGRPDSTEPWRTIVGVVKDVQQWRWAEVDSEVYLPFAQDESFYTNPAAPYSMTLVARTQGDPAAMVKALQQQVWEFDSSIPVSSIVSMQQAVSNALWQPRFSMFLLGVFAAAALVLAAVGVYGVMSYAVTQRTSEIGIRVAMGARRGDVLGLVARQGLALAAAGVVLGLVGAYAVSRVMESLLYEVSSTDAVTFAASAGVLLAVALAACFVPALRASRIDPMEALRYE